MFRLVFATVLGVAKSQCSDCNFDVKALEEFTTDWELVSVTMATTPSEGGGLSVTTGPAPASIAQESGNIAVHARNLQLAMTVDATIGFDIGTLPLHGTQVHEQIHINGATGQASFHIASDVLNMCFLVDGLPPLAQLEHDNIEQYLQQAEQMGPALAQQYFSHTTLDGENDMGPVVDPSQPPRLLFTSSSAPAFVWTRQPVHPPQWEERLLDLYHPRPSWRDLQNLAVKFTNYKSSVGDVFGVRACEVTAHSSTQSLLAESPAAREFVRNRITQHQRRLQAMLQPTSLNTRFNFLELDGLADLMLPKPAQDCASEELAQVPGTTFSALQAAVISVSSFVMAVVVTSAVARKRTATPADDYHRVAA